MYEKNGKNLKLCDYRTRKSNQNILESGAKQSIFLLFWVIRILDISERKSRKLPHTDWAMIPRGRHKIDYKKLNNMHFI